MIHHSANDENSNVEQLKYLFESLEEVYWLKDTQENKLRQISPTCEKVYGISQEAFFKNPQLWLEVIHPEDLQAVLKKQEQLHEGLKIDHEYRIINQVDQSIRWVRDRTIPYFDKSGNITALNGMISDITEKKMLESQLRILGKVFNNAIEGICVTDCDVKIININNAFKQITGYGDEVLGKNPRIFKSGLQDQVFYQSLWAELLENGYWQGELLNRRRNGEVYIQSTTITLLKDNNGVHKGFASIFSDITERKKAEEKLNADLKLATLVQKAVLPPVINNEHLCIAGTYLPSLELAGDMYKWYQISPSKYGIMIIDIMGHGVASSLVVMSISSLLRGIITNYVCPILVFEELNKHMRYLFQENQHDIPFYFTGIYILVDFETNSIQYSNAGHPPGLLIDQKGVVQKLDVGTIPIGLANNIHIEKQELTLQKGSQLILYTDGLIDVFKQSISKNIAALEKEVKSTPPLTNEKQIEKFVTSIEQKHGHFEDDVTMVVMNIK